MSDILSNWLENDFKPWQKKARAHQQERLQFHTRLKGSDHQLKHLVALLLDGNPEGAVSLWNDLALQPQLKKAQINLRQDTLDLTLSSGKVMRLSIKDMITDVQKILA